jgi:FMN phosphatase YigB (HAD superfamily)
MRQKNTVSTPKKILFMDWDDTIIHWGPSLRHPPKWVLKAKETTPELNFLWDSISWLWKNMREISHRIFPRPRDEKIEFFPGVLEFVRELKAEDIKIAIVTNKEEGKFHRQFQHLTETHGLGGLFDAHVAHQRSLSQISVRKPNPQIGVRALKALGIKTEEGMQPVEIIHIGDRHSQDTKFANRLNKLLQKYNQNSSCKSILHNVYDWDKEYLSKLPEEEAPHATAQGYKAGAKILPHKDNVHETVREEVFKAFHLTLPEKRRNSADQQPQQQNQLQNPDLHTGTIVAKRGANTERGP